MHERIKDIPLTEMCLTPFVRDGVPALCGRRRQPYENTCDVHTNTDEADRALPNILERLRSIEERLRHLEPYEEE